MKRKLQRRRFGASMLMLAMPVFFCGCDAEIRENPINKDIHGFADDGDPSQPRDTYGEDRSATDNETSASSDPGTATELGGAAAAVGTNAGAENLPSGVAQAASYNKVISSLVVRKAGQFRFDVPHQIDDIVLVHDGELLVSIRVFILDAQGNRLPNGSGAIASLDHNITSKGAPDYEVTITGAANPKTARNGKYRDVATRSVQLAAGTYQIEFDLRIRATAPKVGPDRRKHEARVGKVTANIELR